jgi:hypothetical protein
MTRAAAARSPPDSPTALRARERGATRQRLSRTRQVDARAAKLAAAREMLREEVTSAFDYKTKGERRASAGAGRVAKCAHVKRLERALTAGAANRASRGSAAGCSRWRRAWPRRRRRRWAWRYSR